MKYNWGIIGTGNIANQMAQALKKVPGANVYAVCARKAKSAEKFGDNYGVRHCNHQPDVFLAHKKLDVVYIATPHPNHYQETLQCLEAGKHVLCEKPIALNSAQAEKLYKKAHKKGLFLMEAMWTQFFPATNAIREIIEKGKIGEIKMIEADFGFKGSGDPEGRHLNKDLGGGALLDVGIYPIYFAQKLMGSFPVEINGQAIIGNTGVDEQSTYLLKYENGVLAKLSSAITTETVQRAMIYGSKASIEIPIFWQPDMFFVHRNGNTKKYKYKRFGNGYTYEVMEVHRCLSAKKKESKILPYKLSIDVMKIMDTIRNQWGLIYPGE